jgi:hypothetical protein
MRPIKTIAWLTLAFWAIQSVAFITLFASIFTRLIVQCLVFVGLPVAETSLNTFLSDTMKVLAWPIHSLFPSTWAQGSFLTNILLLAANSLIWGLVLGLILVFFKRNRRSSPAAQP